MASKLVAVKFKNSFGVYNSSECAGFIPEKAARLVRDGVATYVDKAKAKATEKERDKESAKREADKKEDAELRKLMNEDRHKAEADAAAKDAAAEKSKAKSGKAGAGSEADPED